MNKNSILRLLTLVFICFSTQQASAQIMYGSYGGTQKGVTVRDSFLNQSTFIPIPFTPRSISAGLTNTFYVTVNNNIYRYGANGALLKSFTFPDPLIKYTSATLAGGKFYVSYKGSQLGVSVRNPATLVQTAFFATSFSPNAIAAGPTGTLFLASGNHLYKYSTSGAQLIDMAFPDLGVNYTGIAVKDNRVYASYIGSQQGVTVRDLNLVQLSFFGTLFSPTGIAAGLNNDVYLSAVNHLFRYTTSGTLLKNAPFVTINYTGIASEKSQ